MHAAGASASAVFEAALKDGYKRLDCAFIVAGLFNLDFREARRIGFAIDGATRMIPPLNTDLM